MYAKLMVKPYVCDNANQIYWFSSLLTKHFCKRHLETSQKIVWKTINDFLRTFIIMPYWNGNHLLFFECKLLYFVHGTCIPRVCVCRGGEGVHCHSDFKKNIKKGMLLYSSIMLKKVLWWPYHASLIYTSVVRDFFFDITIISLKWNLIATGQHKKMIYREKLHENLSFEDYFNSVHKSFFYFVVKIFLKVWSQWHWHHRDIKSSITRNTFTGNN